LHLRFMSMFYQAMPVIRINGIDCFSDCLLRLQCSFQRVALPFSFYSQSTYPQNIEKIIYLKQKIIASIMILILSKYNNKLIYRLICMLQFINQSATYKYKHSFTVHRDNRKSTVFIRPFPHRSFTWQCLLQTKRFLN